MTPMVNTTGESSFFIIINQKQLETRWDRTIVSMPGCKQSGTRSRFVEMGSAVHMFLPPKGIKLKTRRITRSIDVWNFLLQEHTGSKLQKVHLPFSLIVRVSSSWKLWLFSMHFLSVTEPSHVFHCCDRYKLLVFIYHVIEAISIMIGNIQRAWNH